MPKIEDIYPLSPMQHGLLFHWLLSPMAGQYVPQIVLTLSGYAENDGLKHSLEEAIQRHTVLRTGFQWEQRDEPFQVVYGDAQLPWTDLDWSDFNEAEQQTKLKNLLEANRTEPFNLHRPPLMRFQWIRRADQSHYLVFCYHHLILDGWSASNLLRETLLVGAIGNKTLAKNETTPPYSKYIAWLKEQDLAVAENFWRNRFSAKSSYPTSYLPYANERDPQSRSLPALQQISLNIDETRVLKEFTEASQLTLNSLLLGTFGLLLSRYSDQRNVVLGTTVSGRPPALSNAMSMIGLFINTLPVLIRTQSDITAKEWLQQIQLDQANSVDFEYTSLRDIQSWVNDGQAMFDCLFVLESYPVQVDASVEGTIRLEKVAFDEWTHFPLTLLVGESDQLQITARYQQNLLTDDTIKRMLGHAKNVLLQIANNPDARLCDISLLTVDEQTQIRSWNDTQRVTSTSRLTEAINSAPNQPLILPCLWQNSENAPSRTTIETNDNAHGEENARYDQLELNNVSINQLAHLLNKTGVGPDCYVAVYLQRCVSLPLVVTAIIKAGGAFVPLDPDYPPQRLQSIINDVQPTALIFDSSQRLPTLDTNAAQMDLSRLNLDGVPDSSPLVNLNSNNAAYMIHTSGSTGKPKGTINTHIGITNRLLWMQDRFQLSPDDRILQKTPIGFDVSIWELLWPMISGATLVIAAPDKHKDAAYLVESVKRNAITTMHFVPPMLDAFLEVDGVNHCSTLRRVICSGDVLTKTTQRNFFELLPHVELHNLYGPAEAAIDVTAWKCEPDSNHMVPIGYPISNTTIHLLDGNLNEVPIGVEGDLHIGGVGLARGYAGRPQLTAEAFIPGQDFVTCSQSKDSNTLNTMYRTGDRARYRPDGAIEFLGRKDHQIKIRGQRIELGEVEAAIRSHPDIRQAVVLLDHEKTGFPILIAYLTRQHNAQTMTTVENRRQLRDFLAARLPDSMIPTHYVTLDDLPVTSNGKVDRSALPSPPDNEPNSAIQPRTETEQAVAEIWREVLGVNEVSINDSFFELGGHSLSATRANTRIRKRFEIELPLRRLFEQPVLEDLATCIDAIRIGTSSDDSTHIEIEIE